MDKPTKTAKRRDRRSFTPEFKAEVVRLCKAGDRSIERVAKDLDLTETALREWVQRADIDAGNGPAGALTTDERAELARLRRENKQLLMDREILKKRRSSSRRKAHEICFHSLRTRALFNRCALSRTDGVARAGSLLLRQAHWSTSNCTNHAGKLLFRSSLQSLSQMPCDLRCCKRRRESARARLQRLYAKQRLGH